YYIRVLLLTDEHRKSLRLFTVVYRDGILCYMALILAMTANATLIFTTPMEFSSLLMPMTRVIHSVLTSRTILHIREAMQRNVFETISLDQDDRELSTIIFERNPQGSDRDGELGEVEADHGAVHIE
ncbi:hypothetical protein V5O48_007404, partial [Marasmius crinis-equi]